MSANVIQVGRVKNVRCVMMNAKWPTAMVTVIVLAANVNVSEAIKEPCAKKVKFIHCTHFPNSYDIVLVEWLWCCSYSAAKIYCTCFNV